MMRSATPPVADSRGVVLVFTPVTREIGQIYGTRTTTIARRIIAARVRVAVKL